MRKQFILVLLLIAALTLTGCGNTDGPIAGCYEYQSSTPMPAEDVAAGDAYMDDMNCDDSIDTNAAPDLSEIMAGYGVLPWQKAYAALLLEYTERIVGEWALELIDIDGDRLCNRFPYSGMFTLHDMNGDGVPELLIWEACSGAFFHIYAAYTFADEEIVPLEIIDRFGGRGFGIFLPPDNEPGLIATIIESGFTSYRLITMEGSTISSPISAFEDWSPRQTAEYNFSLHYVRGADVTPAEHPEDFWRWVHYSHYEEWVARGYVFVSEEEFNWVIDSIFGNPHGQYNDTKGTWPLSINETNILEEIFNQ